MLFLYLYWPSSPSGKCKGTSIPHYLEHCHQRASKVQSQPFIRSLVNTIMSPFPDGVNQSRTNDVHVFRSDSTFMEVIVYFHLWKWEMICTALYVSSTYSYLLYAYPIVSRKFCLNGHICKRNSICIIVYFCFICFVKYLIHKTPMHLSKNLCLK